MLILQRPIVVFVTTLFALTCALPQPQDSVATASVNLVNATISTATSGLAVIGSVFFPVVQGGLCQQPGVTQPNLILGGTCTCQTQVFIAFPVNTWGSCTLQGAATAAPPITTEAPPVTSEEPLTTTEVEEVSTSTTTEVPTTTNPPWTSPPPTRPTTCTCTCV